MLLEGNWWIQDQFDRKLSWFSVCWEDLQSRPNPRFGWREMYTNQPIFGGKSHGFSRYFRSSWTNCISFCFFNLILEFNEAYRNQPIFLVIFLRSRGSCTNILPKSANFPFYPRSILIDPTILICFFPWMFVDFLSCSVPPNVDSFATASGANCGHAKEGLVLWGAEMPKGSWRGGTGTAATAAGEEERARWRGRGQGSFGFLGEIEILEIDRV
jgi:hypothetical protein